MIVVRKSGGRYRIFQFSGFILRDASRSLSSGARSRDPLAMLLWIRSLDPHGEERGNAARLEPRGHGTSGPEFEPTEMRAKLPRSSQSLRGNHAALSFGVRFCVLKST